MDLSLANPIMKDYLIHLALTFPKFRIAELEALADLYNIDVDLSSHNEDSTFLVVSLENDEQARQLISRSVMSFGIYELWGYGETYDKLMKMFEQSRLTSLKSTKMFPLNSILRTFEEDPATREKSGLSSPFHICHLKEK